MRPGRIVRLDGARFGVVVRAYVTRARFPSGGWRGAGPAWLEGRGRVSRVVEIVPFDRAELERAAYVRADRVLGFRVGRELVIARKGRR